ncbi:MAG TPA: FkbM family methyltransferase [Parvibaculum sp.]
MRKIFQSAALKAYGALARTGLMKWPLVRRLFLVFYSMYKTWVESGPIERLQDYVPAGSLVIDIGANVGFFTRKFARWVGEAGRVIAVEPDSENFTRLVAVVARDGHTSRVGAYHGAAASSDGVLHLQRNELHPGDHRLARDEQGIEVRAYTIDTLATADDRARISLIKIDVQGAEMLVLNGAWETIEASRPALFVEIDDKALRDFGSSAEEILDTLTQRNYAPHQLMPKGEPRRLTWEEVVNAVANDYTDVLFLPA